MKYTQTISIMVAAATPLFTFAGVVAAAPSPSFVQVTPSAVTSSKAIDAKDLVAAKKLVGTDGAFHGTVSSVYSPHEHSVVILDFDKNYHSALTAVVKPEVLAKFPSMQTLAGKHVIVSGKFIDYHGHPEIDLTDPAQVKVVK